MSKIGKVVNESFWVIYLWHYLDNLCAYRKKKIDEIRCNILQAVVLSLSLSGRGTADI